MNAISWRRIGHRKFEAVFSCELGQLVPTPQGYCYSSTLADLLSAPAGVGRVIASDVLMCVCVCGVIEDKKGGKMGERRAHQKHNKEQGGDKKNLTAMVCLYLSPLLALISNFTAVKDFPNMKKGCSKAHKPP